MDKRFILKKGANPNYLATICKIGEIYPIENADNLVKTVVNGYDIVVSKDYKEGDIVVYFPVETAICEGYLSANNLYDRSEFERNSNAEEVKTLLLESEDADESKRIEIAAKVKGMCGFFGKNGRVRILKLRGQYSQGFIASVDSLVKYKSELSNVNWESIVGTQFNYIGNDEICWKYIPPIKETSHSSGNQSLYQKRMKKLKKFDRIIDGQFALHYDTKMLSEHISELTPDDIVSISVKVHGCVERNTIVDTKEFGEKTIGDIVDNKIQCSIKSYNTETGCIEYAPINAFYMVPNDGEWYEIELENGKKITITGNNPVWCPDLHCYRRVDELNGDEVLLID